MTRLRCSHSSHWRTGAACRQRARRPLRSLAWGLVRGLVLVGRRVNGRLELGRDDGIVTPHALRLRQLREVWPAVEVRPEHFPIGRVDELGVAVGAAEARAVKDDAVRDDPLGGIDKCPALGTRLTAAAILAPFGWHVRRRMQGDPISHRHQVVVWCEFESSGRLPSPTGPPGEVSFGCDGHDERYDREQYHLHPPSVFALCQLLLQLSDPQ